MNNSTFLVVIAIAIIVIGQLIQIKVEYRNSNSLYTDCFRVKTCSYLNYLVIYSSVDLGAMNFELFTGSLDL